MTNTNTLSRYLSAKTFETARAGSQKSIGDMTAYADNKNTSLNKDFEDAITRKPRGSGPTTLPPTMTAQNSLGIDGPKEKPVMTKAPALRFLQIG